MGLCPFKKRTMGRLTFISKIQMSSPPCVQPLLLVVVDRTPTPNTPPSRRWWSKTSWKEIMVSSLPRKTSPGCHHEHSEATEIAHRKERRMHGLAPCAIVAEHFLVKTPKDHPRPMSFSRIGQSTHHKIHCQSVFVF